jgi:hypothetical protein
MADRPKERIVRTSYIATLGNYSGERLPRSVQAGAVANGRARARQPVNLPGALGRCWPERSSAPYPSIGAVRTHTAEAGGFSAQQRRKIVHLALRHGFAASRLQTAPPTAVPLAASTDQPYHDQQQDGADGGVDDRADNSDTKMDTDLRQEPVADEGANNSDDEVTNQAETCALYDLAGQPPRNEANEQYDKKTFIRHMHGGALAAACLAFPHGPRRLAPRLASAVL